MAVIDFIAFFSFQRSSFCCSPKSYGDLFLMVHQKNVLLLNEIEVERIEVLFMKREKTTCFEKTTCE